MADSWETIGSAPGVDVKSATQVIETVDVLVRTKPSRVEFIYPIPADELGTTYEFLGIDGVANEIETIFATSAPDNGRVVTAYQTEDTDAANLIARFMNFVLEIDRDPTTNRGPFDLLVTMPMKVFGSGGLAAGQRRPDGTPLWPGGYIDDGWTNLQQIAGA